MWRKYVPQSLLIMTLLISGCAPASDNAVSQFPEESTAADDFVVVEEPKNTATPSLPEVASAPSPVAAATSRGDSLVATDPSSVNLAAGVPTLVEFFRFT